MKKLFVSSILASFLCSGVAFAGQSGAFVGLGVGMGGNTLETMDKEKASGVSYGLVAGYNQFFNESFGLRYYVNVDMLNTKFIFEGPKYGLNTLNFGANVDVLYDFITSPSTDFGAFLGVGLGANHFSGKWTKQAKDMIAGDGTSLKTLGFDVALNVGLRALFAKYHGLEIAVKVPFVPHKFATVSGDNMEVKLTQDYNAMLRYTFNF